jgi:PAS domain S-box-containing protein/putative nucleotidyltransferase with HDIG domain
MSTGKTESKPDKSENLKRRPPGAVYTGRGTQARLPLRKNADSPSSPRRNTPAKDAASLEKIRQLQEALQASEDRYRLIFENTSDGIYLVDKDFAITSISPNIGRLLGYSAREMAGRKFPDLDFVAPESRRDAVENLQRVLAGEVIKAAEYKFFSSDGAVRYMEVSAAPLRKSGKVVAAVCVARDITGRKQADEEMEFRALILDAVGDSVFLREPDGRLLYFNESAYKTRGYTREEFSRINAGDLDAGEYAGQLKARTEAILREGQLTFATRHRCRDGSILDLELHSRKIMYAGKVRILTVARDLTERKKAEQLAGKSERRYRLLFDHMLHGMAYCKVIVEDGKPDFVFLETNSAFEKLTGLKDVVGKRVTEVLPGINESSPELLEIAGGVAESGEPVALEAFIHELGIWISTAGYSPEPGYFVMVFDNITGRKKVQEKLEASYVELKKTLDDAVNTMAKIVEIRDPYTSGHQRRVAGLSAAIAREMSQDEALIARLQIAATLHDIGKIYVPAEILSKPGKLGEIEFGIIKTHPAKSYEIVKSMNLPCSIADTVAQHHERMDGSGYPEGLKGGDIILEARILAVADVVEAMASHRPYRAALGLEKALEEIERNRGKLYDVDVVDACLRLFREKGFKFMD